MGSRAGWAAEGGQQGRCQNKSASEAEAGRGLAEAGQGLPRQTEAGRGLAEAGGRPALDLAPRAYPPKSQQPLKIALTLTLSL